MPDSSHESGTLPRHLSGALSNLEPIRMPDEATALHTEPIVIDGVWWGPNACGQCQKRLPPYMVGVPVEISDSYCWGHQIEEGIAKACVDDARRKVMDLYGGNLDHPALEHLEAALAAIVEIGDAGAHDATSDEVGP